MKNEKAKHTPGPWRIQDEYDGTIPIDGWSERAEEWVEICRVSLDMLDTKERAANAPLISACPDLLAACESALNRLMNMSEPTGNQDRGRRSSAISTLATAIDKAYGKGADVKSARGGLGGGFRSLG